MRSLLCVRACRTAKGFLENSKRGSCRTARGELLAASEQRALLRGKNAKGQAALRISQQRDDDVATHSRVTDGQAHTTARRAHTGQDTRHITSQMGVSLGKHVPAGARCAMLGTAPPSGRPPAERPNPHCNHAHHALSVRVCAAVVVTVTVYVTVMFKASFYSFAHGLCEATFTQSQPLFRSGLQCSQVSKSRSRSRL